MLFFYVAHINLLVYADITDSYEICVKLNIQYVLFLFLLILIYFLYYGCQVEYVVM